MHLCHDKAMTGHEMNSELTNITSDGVVKEISESDWENENNTQESQTKLGLDVKGEPVADSAEPNKPRECSHRVKVILSLKPESDLHEMQTIESLDVKQKFLEGIKEPEMPRKSCQRVRVKRWQRHKLLHTMCTTSAMVSSVRISL